MTRLLFGLVFFCVPVIAVAKDVPAYQWIREIVLPDIAETTLVAVPLDSHFFHFTRAGRPDVRLHDDKGAAIGFVIQTASEMKSRTVRTNWTAEQTSAKVDATTGLQIDTVLRDKESLPNGIRIITPLRDFEHQVRVESSADGSHWISAGTPTLIFDYSRHVDARNDLVSLNPNDHRRFRVIIEDITAEQESQLLQLNRRLRGGQETDRTEQTTVTRRPFRVDRIEFFRDDPATATSGQRRMTTYPAEHFEAKVSEKDHRTILSFETQREPVTAIKVITAAENFSRIATVEAEVDDANGKPEWRQSASSTFARFAIGAIRREEVTLTISELGATRYRVVIENRDSPPLSITGVELSGPVYELTFLASKDQKLQLEYGSPEAAAGQFDTAALQAALAQPLTTVAATMQPPRGNENRPVESFKPWNDPRVLIGTIVALTLLLGWGLFRASSRITLPTNEESQ